VIQCRQYIQHCAGRDLQETKFGGKGNRCNLIFADDILSSDREELQEMVRELQRESMKGGLEMNVEKTKYMRNVEGEERVSLENGRIEEVDEYVCILGADCFYQEWDRK